MVSSEDHPLEIRKGNDDDCDIIESSPDQSIFNDVLDSETTLLMDIRCLAIAHAVPHALDNFFIR